MHPHFRKFLPPARNLNFKFKRILPEFLKTSGPPRSKVQTFVISMMHFQSRYTFLVTMASLPSVLSFIKRSNAFILSRTLATVRVSSSGYVPFCRAQHPLLKNARAREVWRPQVLKRSLPALHRVTSQGWYHDGEQERRFLLNAIKMALQDRRET